MSEQTENKKIANEITEFAFALDGPYKVNIDPHKDLIRFSETFEKIKESLDAKDASLAALRKELDDYKKALEVIESECDCDCVVEENHFCIKHEAKNALDVYRTPRQEDRGNG